MNMRNWLPAGAAIFLTACAGLPSYNPTPWWTIHDPAFNSLKPGVSTKEDVRKLIGAAPLTESHFPRLNEDVWEYRYLEGTTIVMLAYVHFDANGVLKYYEQRLDPAFTGGDMVM